LTVGNDRLWSEVSYLAFWFHWPLDHILTWNTRCAAGSSARSTQCGPPREGDWSPIMPWPFRRHRPHDGGQAAPSTAPPVTVDDLGGHRRLMVHAGSWQRLEPLTPSATGAAAPVVSSGASFISGLAGTRPLIGAASLRDVSSSAPRGVTREEM